MANVWNLRSRMALSISVLLLHANVDAAASKPHIIAFGKWNTVAWALDSGAAAADDKSLPSKVRPLLVDGKVREFTFGTPHDVTDRLFVVRRAFRINDSLPQESTSPPHWQWQRGGWLLIDRVTGHISPINLPEFDARYSVVSWYRDYAAYCGLSDDGKEVFAMVAQISRRKPVLKWPLYKIKSGANPSDGQIPDTPCIVPDWQRTPARVAFGPNPAEKQTFEIRGHVADMLPDEKEDKEDEEALK